MTLIGIGVDIVSINRMRRLLSNHPDKVAARILSHTELKIFYNYNDIRRLYFLSKRFACKEAIVKALGTGIGRPYGFADIEILNDDLGKPYVMFLKSQLSLKKNYRFNISISDERDYAIAFVIVSI